jgi:hypothetical protein
MSVFKSQGALLLDLAAILHVLISTLLTSCEHDFEFGLALGEFSLKLSVVSEAVY